MNIISPGQLSPGLVPLADVRAGSYLPSGDCGRLGAGAFLAPAEDNCMATLTIATVVPQAEDNCRRIVQKPRISFVPELSLRLKRTKTRKNVRFGNISVFEKYGNLENRSFRER